MTTKRWRWVPDVLGLLWVTAAAGVALIPTLLHGSYIGPFDLLSHYGLTSRPGVTVHNPGIGDQVNQIIPWITLAWTQVHHGHLPLWTTDEALGMPLAFNWGSGVFSLPSLVSYLTPLRFIYTVQIAVTLLIGGSGAYVFGRVLRFRAVACVFAGTTWVLSGPFFGWLGYPDTSVMALTGWLFAATVLIVRGRHRIGSIVLFAVALALAILGGNPEILVLILLAFVVFVAVVLLYRAPGLPGTGPILRPLFDLVVAGIAGTALAAPLVLPGIQLASHSVRKTAPLGGPSSVHLAVGLITQTFWGLPIAGTGWWGLLIYQPSAAYVGIIGLAFAIVAVGIRWRRPEVAGLAIASVVTFAAAFSKVVVRLLEHLPAVGGNAIPWNRSVIPLAFCLALLGGAGLDSLLYQSERRRAGRLALGAFGVAAFVLGLLWLFGRGTLPPIPAHVRAESFVWPCISTAVGLAALGTLVLINQRSTGGERDHGRTRWLKFGAVGSLLACQTAFLVAAGAPLLSSSSTSYPLTAGVKVLQRAVGSSLVGLGENSAQYGGYGLGLFPDTNVAYGIDEFGVYDPITPLKFFTSWVNETKMSPGLQGLFTFLPGITTATIARRYGISYVLEPRGSPGPVGSIFDTRVGDENLFKIPNAATATLVDAASSGRWPSPDAPGTAVRVERSSSAELRIVTDSSTRKVLRVRLTAVPGWHATIDGRPLSLAHYLSVMFQADIPPGKHVIEFQYWPDRFTAGLIIAACAVVALVAAYVVASCVPVGTGGRDVLRGRAVASR